MNEEVLVDPDIESVFCSGGEDDLGHPIVFYNFGDKNKLVCGYCGKIFLKKVNHE